MPFPQSRMIAVNGVELETFCAGTPGDRPVVLCHGWPEHAYAWRHQVQPLVDAGCHVIVPNQRGYGRSSCPSDVAAYDAECLGADLTGLLDHFGFERATFIGHDWGAINVWNLAMLHPDRVSHVVNLSVPLLERGPEDWVTFWEKRLGPDFYIVHFNRQPGVADAVFDENPERFLRNLYRTGQWQEPAPELGDGMPLIRIAQRDEMPGRLMMSETELAVFVEAFQHSGFTGGINWYRNFARNWELLGRVTQHVAQPTLMIYGRYDTVPQSGNLARDVPDLEVHELECGHWIQQEQPARTSAMIVDWLARHG